MCVVGDDLDRLTLDDLNAKKKSVEAQIKKLESKLQFNGAGAPTFKGANKLPLKDRIAELKKLILLLEKEDSKHEHKVWMWWKCFCVRGDSFLLLLLRPFANAELPDAESHWVQICHLSMPTAIFFVIFSFVCVCVCFFGFRTTTTTIL